MKNRKYSGEPAEQRIKLRKQKLMNAALQLFAEGGGHALAVKVICERAGLTQRYFYESFLNVDNLLIQVYEEQSTLLETQVIKEIDFSATAQEVLSATMATLFTLVEKNPNQARIVFPQSMHVRSTMIPTLNERHQHTKQLLNHLSRPFLPRDLPEGADFYIIASACCGGLSDTISRWISSGFNKPKETMIVNMEIFINAIAVTALGASTTESNRY